MGQQNCRTANVSLIFLRHEQPVCHLSILHIRLQSLLQQQGHDSSLDFCYRICTLTLNWKDLVVYHCYMLFEISQCFPLPCQRDTPLCLHSRPFFFKSNIAQYTHLKMIKLHYLALMSHERNISSHGTLLQMSSSWRFVACFALHLSVTLDKSKITQ